MLGVSPVDADMNDGFGLHEVEDYIRWVVETLVDSLEVRLHREVLMDGLLVKASSENSLVSRPNLIAAKVSA
ncbi:MAG: hypothetical protein AAF664_20360 [Planctomycetota bacterium]